MGEESVSDRIAVIVHGGAGSRPVDEIERRSLEQGCRTAAGRAWRMLLRGESAQKAAVTAVRFLEDHPDFNAGMGSYLNADGQVECDAGIAMVTGMSRRIGAVSALPGTTKNPILVAEALLNEHTDLLSSTGAERFARLRRIPQCSLGDLIVPRTLDIYLKSRGTNAHTIGGDTVGCVALDQHGGMCAAGSTGGWPGKVSGRVGDVPHFGDGFFVDQKGAACASGDGESIVEFGLCRRAVQRLWRLGSSPLRAAELTIDELTQEIGRDRGGIIMLDRQGSVGYAKNTQWMPIVYISTVLDEEFIFVS